MADKLTHLDADGRAHMVDVAGKAVTAREARAAGLVRMAPETLSLALGGRARKGDVIAAVELAGIMAAKRTPDLIPLCHAIAISGVEVRARAAASGEGLEITATVRASDRTGVEMEALTAVSVACLTAYDMLKAVDRGMTIDGVRLLEKRGGRSGDWRRDEA